MLQLPRDEGAERAVLGAILLRPELIAVLAEERLAPEDCWAPPHRLLLRHILEAHAQGEAIDVVTLAARLDRAGELAQAGGFSGLASLASSTPSTAALRDYVAVVRDRAQLRRAIDVAQQLTEHATQSGASADVVLEEAERALWALRGATGTRIVPTAQLVEEVLADLRRRVETRGQLQGLSTGWRDLDGLLQGLVATNLIVVAARPAMGKTAWALNLAADVTLRQGRGVALFSLEMSREQLVTRMLVGEAQADAGAVARGMIDDRSWSGLYGAGEQIAAAPLVIDDTPAITVAHVRTVARRMASERGCGLIVIDYLQLMQGGDRRRDGNREQEISGISRGLKGLAKELQVPVVALAQLNRGVEQRADKRPMMSDLRESGAIEQDADQILFLYRDEVYNPNTEDRGIAEVLVRKNRHGSTGDIKLAWRGEWQRFLSLAA